MENKSQTFQKSNQHLHCLVICIASSSESVLSRLIPNLYFSKVCWRLFCWSCSTQSSWLLVCSPYKSRARSVPNLKEYYLQRWFFVSFLGNFMANLNMKWLAKVGGLGLSSSSFTVDVGRGRIIILNSAKCFRTLLLISNKWKASCQHCFHSFHLFWLQVTTFGCQFFEVFLLNNLSVF